MTWRTVLPTQTDGDLGLSKLDRDSVIDPRRDDSAAQINRRNLDLIEVFARLGLAGDGTQNEINPTSLRTITDRLSGDTYWRRERFEAEAFADLVGWSKIGRGTVEPTIVADAARGGLLFVLDDGENGCNACFLAGSAPFHRAQVPYIRFRAKLTGNPGTDHFLVGFVSSGGTEGCGVRFNATGLKFQGWTETGSVITPVDVGVWVAGTEHVVEFWISGDELWVSLDGAAAVDGGPVPNVNFALAFIAGNGGAAGKTALILNPEIIADWSARAAPSLPS